MRLAVVMCCNRGIRWAALIHTYESNFRSRRCAVRLLMTKMHFLSHRFSFLGLSFVAYLHCGQFLLLPLSFGLWLVCRTAERKEFRLNARNSVRMAIYVFFFFFISMKFIFESIAGQAEIIGPEMLWAGMRSSSYFDALALMRWWGWELTAEKCETNLNIHKKKIFSILFFVWSAISASQTDRWTVNMCNLLQFIFHGRLSYIIIFLFFSLCVCRQQKKNALAMFNELKGEKKKLQLQNQMNAKREFHRVFPSIKSNDQMIK